MTEASVSFAGNLTDDPELRHTEAGIARTIFRVAVSGRREQEASFFTVVVWRDQAEHRGRAVVQVEPPWLVPGGDLSEGDGPMRGAANHPCWVMAARLAWL